MGDTVFIYNLFNVHSQGVPVSAFPYDVKVAPNRPILFSYKEIKGAFYDLCCHCSYYTRHVLLISLLHFRFHQF